MNSAMLRSLDAQKWACFVLVRNSPFSGHHSAMSNLGLLISCCASLMWISLLQIGLGSKLASPATAGSSRLSVLVVSPPLQGNALRLLALSVDTTLPSALN